QKTGGGGAGAGPPRPPPPPHLPNMGSRNKGTELEKGTALQTLAPGLRAMGHDIKFVDFPSGVQGIAITPEGLEGGADPRREGVVLGR
ncbi:hypothetical protein WC434_17165, partial [Bordetella avium]